MAASAQPSDRPARRIRRLVAVSGVAALVLSVPLATAAAGSSAKKHGATPVSVNKANRGKLGTILVSGTGLTLYHFTQDKANKPTCTGGCTSVWPPLLVPSGTSPKGGPGVSGLSSVKLANGTRQVTFHGQPLYRFALDKTAGDAKGQGVLGTWFVVHPATVRTTPTTSPTRGYGY
jgi:predicted lipoprotein with Yx(FWY)xxD motif